MNTLARFTQNMATIQTHTLQTMAPGNKESMTQVNFSGNISTKTTTSQHHNKKYIDPHLPR
uniref:Uncharacterized protein n=1 Tax=Arundo donax TaxID=35708 RepID=A0A0A9AES3_ARUDO